MKGLPLLITLLLITLTVFVSGLLLPQFIPARPSAPLHLIFALGIMPLILGAMTYFVPVLTRTRNASFLALAPALLALVAGGLVSFSLFYAFSVYPFAAVIGLMAVIWKISWIGQRKKEMLGKPHPGLLWYQLALGALLLGLTAILAGYFLPDHWTAIRRLHLHINTLGFIGFTALGTLRVLLPTTGHYADPQAGEWLIRQWPWLMSGTLLIAVGATWFTTLAFLGLICWLRPLVPLLKGLLITHRQAVWQTNGATTPLAGAVLGLLLLILSGGAHSLGWIAPSQTTLAFIPLFLLPLVTGAATHLLPLWITKAQQRDREQLLRIILGQYSIWRTVLFMLGGLFILLGHTAGLFFILVGLGHFILLVLKIFLTSNPMAAKSE